MRRNEARYLTLLFALVLAVPALATIATLPGAGVGEYARLGLGGDRPDLTVKEILRTDGHADWGLYLRGRIPYIDETIQRGLRTRDLLYLQNVLYDKLDRSLAGSDGWLFLANDVREACARGPAQAVVDRVARATRLIADSGRTVVVVIGPDKTTILPERLERPLPACATQGHDELVAALEGADIPGLVPLWGPMSAGSATDREQRYIRRDSHWTDAGGLVAVREIGNLLVPGWSDQLEVEAAGSRSKDEELSRLQGLETVATFPTYRLHPGVPLPSNALIFEDSFFGVIRLILDQALPQAAHVANLRPGDAIPWLPRSELVVIEVVERNIGTEEFLRSLDLLAGYAAAVPFEGPVAQRG